MPTPLLLRYRRFDKTIQMLSKKLEEGSGMMVGISFISTFLVINTGIIPGGTYDPRYARPTRSIEQ